MGWQRLKIWQKTGVVFGGAHLVGVLLLLFTRAGSGEGGVFLALVLEWPLVMLTGDYLPPIYADSLLFVYAYLLVVGTVIYAIMGIILGLVFMKVFSRTKE